QDALAPLKAKVDGFQVAHHGQDSRQVDPQVLAEQLPGQEGEQPPADADRQDPFQHVAGGGHGGGPLAKGAQHVGHARRAAAVLADVVVVNEPRDQDPRVDAAQQVGFQRHRQDDQNVHQHSFSSFYALFPFSAPAGGSAPAPASPAYRRRQ